MEKTDEWNDCVKSSKCFVNTAKSSNILVSGLKKNILNEVFWSFNGKKIHEVEAFGRVALVVIWENAQMSEQFLQWTVPLMHLLIEETLIIFWRRSGILDVNYFPIYLNWPSFFKIIILPPSVAVPFHFAAAVVWLHAIHKTFLPFQILLSFSPLL